MEYPQIAEINGIDYELNTDYKTAISCLEIINDETYNDEDRALLVISLLYKDWEKIPIEDYNKALEIAVKFLKCERDDTSDEEPDMDYIQDMNLIKASFLNDYRIDLDKQDLHWYEFFNLANGLTENCILNRIREIRNYDLKGCKDEKFKSRMLKAKETFKLNKKLTKEDTEKQKVFNELFGIEQKVTT